MCDFRDVQNSPVTDVLREVAVDVGAPGGRETPGDGLDIAVLVLPEQGRDVTRGVLALDVDCEELDLVLEVLDV